MNIMKGRRKRACWSKILKNKQIKIHEIQVKLLLILFSPFQKDHILFPSVFHTGHIHHFF